jgi:hypothetical protein
MTTGPIGATGIAAFDRATGPTGAGATNAGNVTAAGILPDAKTGVQALPKFIRPNFERMPPELKLLKNWVLWGAVWNGSKFTKRPIQISGFGASTINPKHWSSFDDVKQAYERAVQRGYIELREKGKPIQQIPVGGVGFVFDGQPDEDGLVVAGVDFDKVISADFKIASLAAERIKRLGSYCERSVSGYGLHVIVKSHPLPAGIAHGGVELYTGGRFFTMTGRAPENARIVAAPNAFAALAEELQSQSGHRGLREADMPTAKHNLSNLTAADRERLQKLFGQLPVESLADGLETNIEEIRSAVSAIPPATISTEPEWERLARGLAHEAAVYKHQAEQLWEILDTASRSAPGYNEEENRSRWLRHISEAFNRENPITIATVFDLAKKHGWQGWSPPVMATASVPIVWSAAELKVSFSNIPHRQWLYGTYLIRGEITVLAAPGGAGKTALANGIAVEVATGKEKLGEKVWKRDDQKVLYFNGEDSRTEIERRLLAFCRQHNVTKLDIDRLYVAGADDARVQSLSFLSMNGKGATSLNTAGFGVLESALQSLHPDLLVLDPLVVFCGGGNMNDNGVMSLVMRKLKALATKYDCAILIVHHTRKGGGKGSDSEGEAEAISGAAAIGNLARRAIMPVTMTDAEAKAFGVLPSERRQYFKLVDAKLTNPLIFK